jgi:hypothetical protein
MKKSQRISGLVAALDLPGKSTHDRRYLGFFTCFNDGLYYEAHDVLEDLWLHDKHGPDGAFFKGLIQLAGAFVHLKKHRLRPEHPKDRGRLAPASRLFTLARRNLLPYAPHHRDLSVAKICRLCDRLSLALASSKFRENPWSAAHPPQITLD